MNDVLLSCWRSFWALEALALVGRGLLARRSSLDPLLLKLSSLLDRPPVDTRYIPARTYSIYIYAYLFKQRKIHSIGES